MQTTNDNRAVIRVEIGDGCCERTNRLESTRQETEQREKRRKAHDESNDGNEWH